LGCWKKRKRRRKRKRRKAHVAVEELQAAVGELVGQKAAGETDLGVEALEGLALGSGVKADF
jgi:hypothetical protein